MAYSSHAHPWQSYATQIPNPNLAISYGYPVPAYPPYIAVRPPSPSQVNPYSPQLGASPGFSDGGYSVEVYTTPELESAGPSSVETHYSPLFSTTVPQSEPTSSPTLGGLATLADPLEHHKRPEHTVNNMIKAALHDSPGGKAPSRDILNLIKARFPYYADSGRRQKLSSTIRHHLSNSGLFVKVGKTPGMKGKGDNWMYDPEVARAAKAAREVADDKSTKRASRTPSTTSSPYERPRRTLQRGSGEASAQRTVTTSRRGLGPIRVSPKVRPSTRLAMPNDHVPSNPRPIRPATSTRPRTRHQGLAQRPSHGLWSLRGQASLPSSPEPSETTLDIASGLNLRDVVDPGFGLPSFFVPPSDQVPSPPPTDALQLPLPQITPSMAENSLLQVAVSNRIPTFSPGIFPGMEQLALSCDFLTYDDQFNQLYPHLADAAESVVIDRSLH
ncbi:Forkhead box protein D3-A [Tulasnella sp. 427]|nr:Forkhead box protein D3-A [Tulasnella sp. 427]